MAGVLIATERHLSCPNCSGQLASRDPNPAHQVFHSCPGLKGLKAPMVEDGIRCKVEVLERQDYTNGDVVPRDGEGNVVMAVQTTRDDGEDCLAFAPTAHGDVEHLSAEQRANLARRLMGIIR
jgi:hypothetical protein